MGMPMWIRVFIGCVLAATISLVFTTQAAADINWHATGVNLDVVVCKNKTTDEKVRIDSDGGHVPLSGSCASLGLLWDPADNIQVKVAGIVVDLQNAGGYVRGIRTDLVECKNRSRDPQERVRVENPNVGWD